MSTEYERVFDADQHYYEPLDAFTRHLPAEWRERTVQVGTIDGRVRYIVGGRMNDAVVNPTFDPIVRPGALADFFRGNPEGRSVPECLADREPIPPWYRDRDARIEKMTEHRVERAWMLPSLGMAFEEDLCDDLEACAVAFRSFNRWIHDDWGFAYRDRIYAAPYLTMGIPELAAEEVEWALGQGARLFVVRATGVYTERGWRSPGDPYFDAVWAPINEAGATVVVHVAETGGFGLERFVPHGRGILARLAPPLQVVVGHERPIANYLGALVCDKLFDRFPNLRIASVENGSDFLPLLLAGFRRASFQRPGYFTEDPVETFLRHVWVAPFWEDNLSDAVALIGAEHVLWGSDWPHPEGLLEPRDYEKVASELDDPAAVRKIMYANTAALTGVA